MSAASVKPIPSAAPGSVKTLYLIRHAESTYNEKHQLPSAQHMPEESYVNAPLTRRGKTQASTLDGDTKLLIVSPLRRTIQTYAESKLRVGRLVTSALIRERIQTWSDRMEHETTFDAPYESLNDLWKRVHASVAFIKQQPEDEITLVSHGLYLSTLHLQLTGRPLMIGNAQVAAIVDIHV